MRTLIQLLRRNDILLCQNTYQKGSEKSVDRTFKLVNLTVSTNNSKPLSEKIRAKMGNGGKKKQIWNIHNALHGNLMCPLISQEWRI